MRGDHQRLVPRFHAHLHDVWSRLATSIPGGWVGEAGGLRCIATGSASPSFNLVLSGDGVRDPQLALDRARERFEEAGLRWLLKLQPERDRALVAHARERGLHLDEEPLATSMLATTAEVGLAGVYSVATRPAHRGRGFGTEVTAAALNAAVRQGYETAVLEPSPSGVRLYRRMGFELVTTYLEAVMSSSDGS